MNEADIYDAMRDTIENLRQGLNALELYLNDLAGTPVEVEE